MSIDRYKQFRVDNTPKNVPFIKLKQKSSDKEISYRLGIDRMDLLSYKYYEDASYGWLIMLANPEYGSLEFEIPDGSPIIIPYPFETSIQQYNSAVSDYVKYYGI